MANVNAKVTTKTGDAGYTSLLGKGRVTKYDSRIEAIGTLDEASSALGLARATSTKTRVKNIVYNLQKNLYLLMAELATPPENYDKVDFKIVAADVARLEGLSEELKAEVSIAPAFIVPGDTQAGAALDLARTVVRRAERHVARLLHEGAIDNAEVLRFLNRLSDLVFILARCEEAEAEEWNYRRTA